MQGVLVQAQVTSAEAETNACSSAHVRDTGPQHSYLNDVAPAMTVPPSPSLKHRQNRATSGSPGQQPLSPRTASHARKAMLVSLAKCTPRAEDSIGLRSRTADRASNPHLLLQEQMNGRVTPVPDLASSTNDRLTPSTSSYLDQEPKSSMCQRAIKRLVAQLPVFPR